MNFEINKIIVTIKKY